MSHEGPPSKVPEDGAESDRRSLLSRFSGLFMAGGLIAGYGMFTHIAGRFLYPAKEPKPRWLFVSRLADMKPGDSKIFKTPGGASVVVARQGPGAEDFIALSSVCPHLGCQVHWQTAQSQFFCPCHNGSFDANGKPTGGPPLEADQSLEAYPLRAERGLLYIGVTEQPLSGQRKAELSESVAPTGPGQDPCLFQRPRDF